MIHLKLIAPTSLLVIDRPIDRSTDRPIAIGDVLYLVTDSNNHVFCGDWTCVGILLCYWQGQSPC
jgi:hypothetical protein